MSDSTASPVHKTRSGFWTQLWVWVLIAMALGVVLGIVDPQLATQMQPLGDVFIKLISMLIGPLIFCTIVSGMAHMADMTKVGRVAIKAIIVFEVMTTLAMVIGLIAVNILRPGVGMNIDASTISSSIVEPYLKQTSQVALVPFLLNIIPTTLVGAFVQDNILQALFVAVLCGFALIWIGAKAQPLVDVLEVVMQMIFRIVGMIMWVAPIGAFGAIAFTVGKFGIGSLEALSELVGEFYVTCIIFIIIVSVPIARWCGFSFVKFIRYFWDEILVSIATTSSETVLPRVMTKLQNLGCDKGVVGLVVPAGYSFDLTGACLYLAMATVFLAQATNTPLTLMHQIGLLVIMNITSKGSAGISGAAFVVLTATISIDGTIPVTSVAMILGIHRLLSQGFTPTFVVTNTVATIGIAKWENALDADRMKQVLDGGSPAAQNSLPHSAAG